MPNYSQKTDEKILEPGVVVGIHPDTGVLHKLTIYTNGDVLVERKPYVSDNADKWTYTYNDVLIDGLRNTFLILKIRQNPAEWYE